MGSEDMLVMAMALPPMWLAMRLWWSARHAVDELRESWAVAFGARAVGATRFEAAGGPDFMIAVTCSRVANP